MARKPRERKYKRLFLAADLHGSEVTFRKFLAAAFYDVDGTLMRLAPRRLARLKTAPPESRCSEASSMAKLAPPHAVVLGDARVTINAIPAQVFEALTNPEQLVERWGDDVRVEAQIGGVCEATLPSRRLEDDDHDDRGSPKTLFRMAARE